MSRWSAVVASIALCLTVGCKVYDANLSHMAAVLGPDAGAAAVDAETSADSARADIEDAGRTESTKQDAAQSDAAAARDAAQVSSMDASAPPAKPDAPKPPEPIQCGEGVCWWTQPAADSCRSTGRPNAMQRPAAQADRAGDTGELYFGWTHVRLGETALDGKPSDTAWQSFGLDLDGRCTNASTCPGMVDVQACRPATAQIPFDGALCRDNRFGHLQSVLGGVPEIGERYGIHEDALNCNLWRGTYNVVLKLSGYNGTSDDSDVRVDLYLSTGLERMPPWACPSDRVQESYPQWQVSAPWQIDRAELSADITKPGSLPASKLADAHAYVRANYLVAQLPDDALLRFASRSTTARAFVLKLQQSLWTAQLQRTQDGTWRMSDGLVAGRMRTSDVMQSFRRLGLCGGGNPEGFYRVVSDAVRDDADLLSSGQIDANAACDAISFGMAFTASQLTPGAAATAPNLVECCAPGVDLLDCDPKCGDGRLNGNERCDTAITGRNMGACPRMCPAIDACTPQVLSGEGCSARCMPAPITAVGPKDGCCPKGANGSRDADCPSVCGNGVIEPNETCDPSSSCPTSSCTSRDKCFIAKPSGDAKSCNFRCAMERVEECRNDDGCCPDGCTSVDDSDCSPSCGNKTLEDRETCEAETEKPCPSSCDDGDGCTKDSQIGSAQMCNVVCSHERITAAANGDGCCPDSANANSDNDCQAVCGNGTQENGEECDDGNDAPDDGCTDCKNDTAAQRCRVAADTFAVAECTACSCEKCTDAFMNCYALNNADDARLCRALLECAHTSGCDANSCYCGNANSALCLLGQGNGPCRGQVEAATKTRNPLEVLGRNGDRESLAGRAYSAAQCSKNNCGDACK